MTVLVSLRLASNCMLKVMHACFRFQRSSPLWSHSVWQHLHQAMWRSLIMTR